jgi:hypothetical protein
MLEPEFIGPKLEPEPKGPQLLEPLKGPKSLEPLLKKPAEADVAATKVAIAIIFFMLIS